MVERPGAGGGEGVPQVQQNLVDIRMQERDVEEGAIGTLGSKGYLDITNFITDPNVVYNENNLPFATSIRVQLPEDKEITPIQTDALYHANGNNSNQANLIPFNIFENNVPNTTTVNVGNNQSLLVLERTTDNEEGVSGNAVTVIENDTGVGLLAKMKKNCKYYVTSRFHDPQLLAQDLYWLNRKYNDINKIIGLAKLSATALLAAAKDDQQAADDSEVVWYNGNVYLSKSQQSIEGFIIPEGPTIAEQLNGNIYADEVIEFIYSN